VQVLSLGCHQSTIFVNLSPECPVDLFQVVRREFSQLGVVVRSWVQLDDDAEEEVIPLIGESPSALVVLFLDPPLIGGFAFGHNGGCFLLCWGMGSPHTAQCGDESPFPMVQPN
jgi:hypothetical protein